MTRACTLPFPQPTSGSAQRCDTMLEGWLHADPKSTTSDRLNSPTRTALTPRKHLQSR
eukprot:m.374271 g.374271  ORF g.374271 m.374271 type:complete len:58 (+) comp28172_c0_seq1:4006-4179(+)